MKGKISELKSVTSTEFIKAHKLTLSAYGIFIVVSLVAYFIWINPLLDELNQLNAQIAQESKLIEKYKRKLKESANLKEALRKKKQELEGLKKKLFPGKDPYELATKLEQIAQKELSIRSYQITSTKEYSLYKEVRFRFVLDTNIIGLHKLTKWMVESAPYIVVKDINIRRISRGRNKSSLMVNLTLTALMQKKG